MISEALWLHVNGGGDSHSWCMCVISHGYGGLCVGARMEVVDCMHGGQSQCGWWYLGCCRSTSQVPSKHTYDFLVTLPSRWTALGRVERELFCLPCGLPGKALAGDATRRLQLLVHAVSDTHHGAPWTHCSSRYS